MMSQLKMEVPSNEDSSEDESSGSEPPRKRICSSVLSPSGTDRSSTELSDDDGMTSFSSSTMSANRFNDMMKPAEPSSSFMDSKGHKMMRKMGFEVGKGLGKHAQGRVDPIEMSKQRGRRGFGMKIAELDAAVHKWNPDEEVISCKEDVMWLEEEEHEVLSSKTLEAWIKKGPEKLNIEDETHFCDPVILKEVLSSKSVFDKLDGDEMRKARTRSNPFETIRGAFFLNRAAMKMANMDKVFDFMFTNPKDEHGYELLGPNDLLYFADVCAGPGGFSEYVLWRRKWKAKGFGFTLKGENDFRLADFYAAPCETFEPHYGVNGTDGDGNIFNPDNIRVFTEYVLQQTHDYGVHFMMADGGFSVDGQENIQEILSKQLYLCQFLVALNIVRSGGIECRTQRYIFNSVNYLELLEDRPEASKGGHFVCKLFDLFTPFSVGLVYLMYKAFQKISIHKPNTSRPANSERYIVCKWKRDDTRVIAEYLFKVNLLLWKKERKKEPWDVMEVVPLERLFADKIFYSYITESNNILGKRQVVNLAKIAAFCQDTTLFEQQQAEMKRECLEYWEVPDKARTAPPRTSPDIKCEELLKKAKCSQGVLSSKETELQPKILKEVFKSVYDWHCVVLGSSRDRPNCAFYLGMGHNRVYRLEHNRWHKVEANIELSPDTLFYGELVQELRGEGRSQRKLTTLHIIDAVFVGGDDISHLHITERHKICCKFAEALNKPIRTDLTPLRVKELYELEEVEEVFRRLDQRTIKGAGGQHRLVYSVGTDDRFYLPGGLMFFKATKEPWMRHESRSTHYKYYFHQFTKDSKYDKDRPQEACASFMYSFQKRHVWWWEDGVRVHDEHHSNVDVNKLQRDDVLLFVDDSCRPNH